MTTTLERYRALSDRFGTVVEGLPSGGWDAPSACEDWTGRQVVEHVIDTTRDFLARQGIDLGPRPDLADPAAAWRTHDDAVRAVLADESVAAREYDGYFGRTTIGETIVGFYGFDLMVHRWDLAEAGGLDERFTDPELDALERSIEGFGEHLYDEGVCRPAVPVLDDADRQTRVLARLGRRERSHDRG